LILVSGSAHGSLGLYHGGSYIWACPFASSLLSGLEKKCLEDKIAITHDDDLQLIENVVRPREYVFDLMPTVTRVPRKPSVRIQ